MTTTTLPPTGPPPKDQVASKEEQPNVERGRKRHTGLKLLGILVVWLGLYFALQGKNTKALGLQDLTDLHRKFNEARDWVQLEGDDNWFFGGVLGAIGDFLNSFYEFFQELIASPAPPRPVPEIGWIGVIALAAWVTYVFAGLRSTILVILSMLVFGVFGLWEDSMETLIVTILSVIFCMIVGLPLGIWMSRRKVVSAVVTPILDLMQTIPAFCYLAPVALFFGIGASAALVLTFIYALPPLVRITEHGINTVSGTTVEAARSLGLTGGQMLRQVQLPMARRTIVVGINQSHDGGAVDGHDLRTRRRARSRQAGDLGAPGPQRRRRVGGGSRHRRDGDHARPHHHRRQRAFQRTHRRRGGQRAWGHHRRGRARAPAALGDRGRRQGSAPAAPHQGRPLAPPGAAADPGRLLRLAVPLRPPVGRVPGHQRDPGPEVHQRPRADPLHQRVHRLVRRRGGLVHDLAQGLHHRVADQPLRGPAGSVALVGDGPGAAGHRRTCSAGGGRP